MATEILILGHSHRSNTVFSLAFQLAKEFADDGASVTIVDIFNSDALNRLSKYSRNQFKHIFFMGHEPLNLRYGEEYLFNYLLGNIYYWVLDPIIYDFTRTNALWIFLKSLQNNYRFFFLFPDRSYMEFMRNFLGDKAIYFPFAASLNAPNLDNLSMIKAIKGGDVLVLANYGQELSEFATLDLMSIVNTLDPFNLSPTKKTDLVNFLMQDEENSNVAMAIKRYIGFSDRDLLRYQILPFLVAVDASEKRRRRFNILNSIKYLKVDVIGSGWSSTLGSRSNINYLEINVQHDRVCDLFLNYKVLLDFSPNWDAGFNDRVLNALASGCRVVTTKNSALEELGDVSRYISTYSAHFPNPEVQIENFLDTEPVDESMTSMVKKQNWMSRIKNIPSMQS